MKINQLIFPPEANLYQILIRRVIRVRKQWSKLLSPRISTNRISLTGSQAREIIGLVVGTEFPQNFDSELSNRDLTDFRHGSTSLQQNLGKEQLYGMMGAEWAERIAVKRERWRCSFEKRGKKWGGKREGSGTNGKKRKRKERKGKRFPRFLSKENSSKENRKVRGNVRAYLNEARLDTRK